MMLWIKRNLEKEKQFQTIFYQRDRCRPAVTKGVPEGQVGARAFCRPWWGRSASGEGLPGSTPWRKIRTRSNAGSRSTKRPGQVKFRIKFHFVFGFFLADLFCQFYFFVLFRLCLFFFAFFYSLGSTALNYFCNIRKVNLLSSFLKGDLRF